MFHPATGLTHKRSNPMSNRSKKEYVASLRELYKDATRKQKTAMLEECCRICLYNRKYAITLLNTRSKFRKAARRAEKSTITNLARNF